MAKRNEYDMVAERHAGTLLDDACPHGGGGNMKHECFMCVLATVRAAVREGAQVAKERSWENHVRRTLVKGGAP